MKVKFWIGDSKETQLPAIILRHSIKKFSVAEGYSIEVQSCPSISTVLSINADFAATPFSFNRLAIPLAEDFDCFDYHIYLDSDMYFLRSYKELLEQIDTQIPISVVAHPFTACQSSLLIFNPSKIKVASYKLQLQRALRAANSVDSALEIIGVTAYHSAKWNSLDFITEDTALVHFTYMPTQPWINPNSRYFLFYQDIILDMFETASDEDRKALASALLDGVANSFVSPRLIDKRIRPLLKVTYIVKPALFIPYWFWFRLKGRKLQFVSYCIRAVSKLKIRAR